MKKLLYCLSLIIVAACALTACGSAADATGEQLRSADEAITSGNYTQAQEILDNLARNGFDGFSEENLGRMAVTLMRLSEHSDNEENIAVATKCYLGAIALSADSLRAFSASLSTDELANFYLVKRIASGIDNPVDLSAEEFTEEDMVGFDSIAPLEPQH